MRLWQAVAASSVHSSGSSEAAERTGTLIGSFATQLIMIGTMATFATLRSQTGGASDGIEPDDEGPNRPMQTGPDRAQTAPTGRAQA